MVKCYEEICFLTRTFAPKHGFLHNKCVGVMKKYVRFALLYVEWPYEQSFLFVSTPIAVLGS